MPTTNSASAHCLAPLIFALNLARQFLLQGAAYADHHQQKTTDPQLYILETSEPGCWINVVDPLPAEIKWVSEELGIPIDYLSYPLDIGIAVYIFWKRDWF